MRRQISIANERTDTQPSIWSVFDAVQSETIEIDEVRRFLDLQLHQVEKIGASGDEARVGPQGGFHRIGGAGCAMILERPHDLFSATSRIAAIMLG
jgi:hypothetical protein